jgi:hypothetical protein
MEHVLDRRQVEGPDALDQVRLAHVRDDCDEAVRPHSQPA